MPELSSAGLAAEFLFAAFSIDLAFSFLLTMLYFLMVSSGILGMEKYCVYSVLYAASELTNMQPTDVNGRCVLMDVLHNSRRGMDIYVTIWGGGGR